eukprot:SAG31_NODE_2245_length_6101_cov_1.381539_3_plen_109_part_00
MHVSLALHAAAHAAAVAVTPKNGHFPALEPCTAQLLTKLVSGSVEKVTGAFSGALLQFGRQHGLRTNQKSKLNLNLNLGSAEECKAVNLASSPQLQEVGNSHIDWLPL